MSRKLRARCSIYFSCMGWIYKLAHQRFGHPILHRCKELKRVAQLFLYLYTFFAWGEPINWLISALDAPILHRCKELNWVAHLSVLHSEIWSAQGSNHKPPFGRRPICHVKIIFTRWIMQWNNMVLVLSVSTFHSTKHSDLHFVPFDFLPEFIFALMVHFSEIQQFPDNLEA